MLGTFLGLICICGFICVICFVFYSVNEERKQEAYEQELKRVYSENKDIIDEGTNNGSNDDNSTINVNKNDENMEGVNQMESNNVNAKHKYINISMNNE